MYFLFFKNLFLILTYKKYFLNIKTNWIKISCFLCNFLVKEVGPEGVIH
jgi:hypothetical protein